VQQHYHVRFAQVVDHVGHAAERLSTKSLLKIMGWVSQYQDTLRNLGVEEALVHLPIAPQSDPEGRPGLKLLIEVYTGGWWAGSEHLAACCCCGSAWLGCRRWCLAGWVGAHAGGSRAAAAVHLLSVSVG
jgi:hypothetical protein